MSNGYDTSAQPPDQQGQQGQQQQQQQPIDINAPGGGVDLNAPGGIAPPSQQQNFIPYPYKRSIGEMGSWDFIRHGMENFPGVSPGPFAPQPNDTMGLVRSIGMGLGRGPMNLSPTALAMMRYYIGFKKGQMQGQQFAAQMEHDKYANEALKLEVDTAKYIKNYGAIFEAYRDPKDRQKRLDALYQQATIFNDDAMKDAIKDSSDPEKAVERVLAYYDLQYGNLSKLNSQRSKAASSAGGTPGVGKMTAKEAATSSVWGLGGPAAAEEPKTDPLGIPLDDEPERPRVPPSAAGGTLPDGTKAPDDPIAKESNLSATDARLLKEAGANGIEGQDMTDMDPTAHAIAQKYQLDMTGKLRDLGHGTAPMSEDDVIKAADGIHEGFGDYIQSMLKYQAALPSLGANSSRGQAFRIMMSNIALRANPQWDAQHWKQLQDYKDSFANTSSPANRTLARSRQLLPAAVTAFREINTLQSKGLLTNQSWANFLNQMVSNNFTGDPAFRGLWSAMRLFANETQAVAGGGQASVTQVQELMRIASEGASPAQLREVIQNEISSAKVAGESYNEDYQTQTEGKEATPGYNKTIFDGMDQLLQANVDTGKIDIPAEKLNPYVRGIAAGASVPVTPQPTVKEYGGKRYYKWPDGHWDDAPPPKQ